MRPLTRRTFAHALASLAAVGLAGTAFAQSWPTKPVRFIVPFQVGFAADAQARVVAQKLAELWGQPVVVENRAGAGGVIGTEAASKAAPDGYTLFLGGNAVLAVNPPLYRKVAYDPVRDFDPVSMVSTLSLALVVDPALPVKSVPELVAWLKARPGKVNFGSTGNGTTVHLAGELFKTMTGVDMVHVPYQGGTVLTDLSEGRVSLMFGTIAPVKPLVQGGRLRALATTGTRRAAAMPDLPTVAEAGVPGFAVEAWFAVFVPAGTPKDIVAKVNRDLATVLGTPEVRDKLSASGLEPVTSTPDELRDYLAAEIVKWRKVVETSGAQVN